MAETKTGTNRLRDSRSMSMIGLLIVAIIIGFKWLVSGFTTQRHRETRFNI